MTKLSAKDRRALSTGALVVFVAFGVVRGQPALARLMASARDDLVIEQRSLATARALVAGAPEMRDSLLARRQRLARNAAALIVTSDPNAASSALGALVTSAARDVNVSVSAIRMRPDSGKGAFNRPRVAVEARGDISGLMQLLLLIEGGTPLMSVIEITITQPDPVGVGRAEELALRIVVEGIARTDTGSTRRKR